MGTLAQTKLKPTGVASGGRRKLTVHGIGASSGGLVPAGQQRLAGEQLPSVQVFWPVGQPQAEQSHADHTPELQVLTPQLRPLHVQAPVAPSGQRARAGSATEKLASPTRRPRRIALPLPLELAIACLSLRLRTSSRHTGIATAPPGQNRLVRLLVVWVRDSVRANPPGSA